MKAALFCTVGLEYGFKAARKSAEILHSLDQLQPNDSL